MYFIYSHCGYGKKQIVLSRRVKRISLTAINDRTFDSYLDHGMDLFTTQITSSTF